MNCTSSGDEFSNVVFKSLQKTLIVFDFVDLEIKM